MGQTRRHVLTCAAHLPVFRAAKGDNGMTREHIVKSYDSDIDRIVAMGGMAEAQVGGALIALRDGDTTAAGKVLDNDDALDLD